MHFARSFKDNTYIYFLEEYIRGMELFDVIRDIGLLNTYDS
jgi:cGMP-dependent protein kinase